MMILNFALKTMASESTVEVNQDKEQLNKELIIAAEKGDISIIKDLIKKGADNLEKGSECALNKGEIKAVKFFIENNSRCTPIKDQKGNVTFYFIERNVNDLREIINIMNKKTEELNKELLSASEKGDFSLVKELIEKGADQLNQAAKYALINGHLETAKILFDEGADNPEELICIAEEKKYWKFITYMIRACTLCFESQLAPWFKSCKHKQEIVDNIRVRDLGDVRESIRSIVYHDEIMDMIDEKIKTVIEVNSKRVVYYLIHNKAVDLNAILEHIDPYIT